MMSFMSKLLWIREERGGRTWDYDIFTGVSLLLKLIRINIVTWTDDENNNLIKLPFKENLKT